ncbi:MAG: DUF5683 domain-containing protein [Bacteroidota bacterium]
MNKLVYFIFLIGVSFFGFSQEQDSLSVDEKESILIKEMKKSDKEDSFGINLYDPLAPAKAAFYSAVVPGLGQAYNKKYWKIPLVYAALGTTIYFYIDNNNQYERYRNAYRQRLTGQEDEFAGVLSNANLVDAQKLFRGNRDISLLFVIGAYILNIVDANVDAHLQQFNVSENLSLKPNADRNFFTGEMNYGVTINLKLK